MKLNELLGIEFPFIQGGMANIATAEFAAAVSNAGALGLIGAGGMSPEVFRDSIRRCRQLTDKPFGVNIMLMHPQVEELAAIAAEEKVAVVTTGAGDPSRFIPAWKEAGIKVFPVVPAVALAKLVAKRGADGVIAEGTESGGHVGETTTMALCLRWWTRWTSLLSPPAALPAAASCWLPTPWAPSALRWAPACWSARSAPSTRTTRRPF